MRFDDASRALVELAASRHNAFHTYEAADIPTARLRRAEVNGDLTRLHRRVWAVTSLGCPPGQESRAATLAISGAALAHHSGCWIHQWIDDPPKPVEVWTPYKGRRRLRGVKSIWAERIDPARDIVEVDGIRCLNKAATLCLLGRCADDDFVSLMLDEYLRTESKAWLLRTLERLHRSNDSGTARLTRVLNDTNRVGGVTDSMMERMLVDTLSGANIGGLVVQHPVTVGGRTYRLDLAIPAIKLGIEAHSRTYHWGRTAEDADNVRDLLLGSVGWKILYVTWPQLQRSEELVALVVGNVRARRAS